MTEATEFSFPHTYRTDRRGPVRWILSHALRQGWLLGGGTIGAIGNASMGALVPVLIGRAVNAVKRGDGDTATLAWFALAVTASQLGRMALQFLRGASFEIVAQRMERNTREELYKSLLGKSMAFHSLQPVGDIMARATNDVRELNFLFSPGVNWIVGSFMFLIMPLWWAPRYHPELLAVPAAFLVGYLIVMRIYLGQLAPAARTVRRRFGALNARLNEALDGVEQVKGASREDEESKRVNACAGAYRDAYVRQGDIEARFLPMAVLSVTLAAGLCHALLLYRRGLIEIGDVVGYFGVLMLLDFPTFASMFAYSRIASGLAAAQRILAVLNTQNPVDQNLHGYARPMQGEISFDQVCFAYEDGAEPCLKEVSFHVKPGQRVAIVGQTGSGKTTLAKLVNRTMDATGGTVAVDGHDVRQWSLAALRQSISIIEQDVFLFSKSVAYNIAFGRPDATRPDIEQAARLAQAHDFIMDFENGYDTTIGERGVALSGGQRQRLALARAFLTDPRILVLDDSTSAIDSATEDRIQRAIFAASRGRTTLIITHRLSQIRWADLILVLSRGRLVAAGTHDDLMQNSLPYQRIFRR